jgi:hypothetical protein
MVSPRLFANWVTRLDDFFAYWAIVFFENNRRSTTFVLHFRGKNCALMLTKKRLGLGKVWAIFFTKSSGRPVCNLQRHILVQQLRGENFGIWELLEALFVKVANKEKQALKWKDYNRAAPLDETYIKTCL